MTVFMLIHCTFVNLLIRCGGLVHGKKKKKKNVRPVFLYLCLANYKYICCLSQRETSLALLTKLS